MKSNSKFDRLYEKTMRILDWEEEQCHINEEQAILLRQNITAAKEEIENEEE